MESLEVKALRKLPQLRGKDLQEIIEICDQDARLAAACFRSVSSLKALAAITGDKELADFVSMRRDLRESELRDFMKAISEGYMWDYGIAIQQEGRALMMAKRKLLSANDERDFVFAKIDGTLPTRGTHGVILIGRIFYRSEISVNEEYEQTHLVAIWNPEDDYVTTKEFKREAFMIAMYRVYSMVSVSFEEFDATRLNVRHTDGTATTHDISGSELTLSDYVNYAVESPGFNIFADLDGDRQEITLNLEKDYLNDDLRFAISAYPVQF